MLMRAAVGLVSLVALAACSPPGSPSGKSSAEVVALAAPEPPVGGAESRLRLLSRDQYFNTIGAIFGEDVLPDVSFAPFQRTEGLIAVGGAYEGVTGDWLEKYSGVASAVATRVVSIERRSFLIPCKPANPEAADIACATKFLAYAGQRLYRRPLRQDELHEVVTKAASGAEKLNDFYAGLSLAFEGLLISPKTLFIEDALEPDPRNPGKQRVDAYTLASRLSFFLWNMAPDDTLLKAAASGDLHDLKSRTRIVDAMLKSPNLEKGVRAFFDDMLGFDSFANLAKDPSIYPAFTGSAVTEAREQALRMIFAHLVTQKGDYRDLFTTRATVIGPSLAQLYREPITRNWTPYIIPESNPRVGLLTQIGFLSLNSHPGRTSPTYRGKAIREQVMCQPVPSPPGNVDFSALEDPSPNLRTARDRLTAHATNPVCGGCHKITDPIGLAFENFDSAGQYRVTEKGAPIDASGNLDGKAYKDAAGLGQALHDSPVVTSCLVKRVYGYATGVRFDRAEQPLIDYFNTRFAAEGYQLPSLMRMIALSASFSQIQKSSEVPAAAAKTASVSPQSDPTTSGTK